MPHHMQSKIGRTVIADLQPTGPDNICQLSELGVPRHGHRRDGHLQTCTIAPPKHDALVLLIEIALQTMTFWFSRLPVFELRHVLVHAHSIKASPLPTCTCLLTKPVRPRDIVVISIESFYFKFGMARHM